MSDLLILASPRKNGFSNDLISLINSEELASFRLLNVYEKNIKPCLHCDYCVSNRNCFIEDDMSLIYEAIQEARRIVIISPIYFLNWPSPLKALIDRTQVFWNHPLKKDKKAAVLLIAEQKNAVFEEFYYKSWQYILKNLGVEDFFFKLLGEINKLSDIFKQNVIKDMFSFLRGG